MIFIKPPGTTTEAWILQLGEWLVAAQADAAAGKTITQVGAGDVYSTKQVQSSPATRIKQLLQALAYYDPTNYSMPVTRTTIQFQ